MNDEIHVRNYKDDDTQFLAEIYYHTIHNVNIHDYSKAQVDVWASLESLELEGWKKKWKKLKPLVAVVGNDIVGFSEFEPNGHIDCFYAHHEWIGKGVGSALMKAIEEKATSKNIPRIYAEVSITAKPFFEKKGFVVITQQSVVRKGIELTNFLMEK